MDFHESLTLQKTLLEWLGDSVKDETLGTLTTHLPYDYTLDQINERSTTKLEYIQYLMTLTLLRRSFFQRGTAMYHAMDLVYEFATLRLSECIGIDHRCVYRKNSVKQEIEDARQKQIRLMEKATRKRQRIEHNEMARIRSRRRREESQRHRREQRELARIVTCAQKYEHCVKLWNDDQRRTLIERIQRSDPATQLRVLKIVDYYIPGTLESGELYPMQWTTQTCRHISSRCKS